MDDPHANRLDPGLLCSNTLMTAKHAQGELVDPRLQHGAELLLEVVGGCVLWDVTDTYFILTVAVQQTIRVCCVVIVVSLDQGEEGLCHIASLLCLRGGGARGTGSLGSTSPSGEAEAAPAAVPGGLSFVSGTLTGPFLVTCTPRRAAHFYTLHFKLSRRTGLYYSFRCVLLEAWSESLLVNKVHFVFF